MSSFILGMCFAGGLYAGNKAAYEIMSKVHEYNQDEMSRLKIPGYPIYSYIKFKMKQNKEKGFISDNNKKSDD